MSRPTLPFAVSDISTLARALGSQLTRTGFQPSHVELLNMLARSAGFRNFQHFRTAHAARNRLEQAARPSPLPDHVRVAQVARHFDSVGRLVRWPAQLSHQDLCLWVLWSRLAPREASTERQISEALQQLHLFGDHALLRRALVDLGLVTRTADGRLYRRIERSPPPEALALIRYLGRQQAA
jgi:hypothetical protein